jgi:hypothetical protein
VAGACECGCEPLGTIKCGEFRDWLRNWRVITKGLSSMESGSYHSMCEIFTAPGVTITGVYRQLQGSSFLQKYVIPTRLHCVTSQKTSVVCFPSLSISEC